MRRSTPEERAEKRHRSAAAYLNNGAFVLVGLAIVALLIAIAVTQLG